MYDADRLEVVTVCEEFLADCLSRGFSKRTVQSYRSSLRPWLAFLKERGVTLLSEVSRELLVDYRHFLHAIYHGVQGGPIAASTLAQKIGALRECLRYCVRIGRLLINPDDSLPSPRLPKPLPRGILTPKQAKKLLLLPDTSTLLGFRDRVILEIFYATAIRRGELVAIRVADCHLAERQLFVRQGKGNKQRWVPMGHKVAAIVQEYLSRVRPALCRGKRHDALIVGDHGGPIIANRVQKIVSGYLKRLGVKSDCHGLRHTCATHLLKGKANIRVIQSLLGHASLSSTQIYTHVEISDLAKAIARSHPRENMVCDLS